MTLTLPDGRRTTFVFDLVPTVDADDLPGSLDAIWKAAPGVHATLVTPDPTTSESPGDNTLICLWGLPPVWRAGYSSTPMEAYDFPTLILTTQDGTRFRIDRDPPDQPQSPTYVYQDEAGDFGNPGGTYYLQPHPGKPRLTRIEQRTGDQILIGNTSIEHRNTNNVLTRTIRFDRDGKNRITALRDPIAGTDGLPTVRYVYNDDTGNLIRVLRLVDRVAGTYLTNVYHYDHPRFPHYITAIDDARGVPVARNLYDDNGKLIGIIDADGRTNTITHNLTNRIEQIVDRLGNTNSFAYDLRGNVTAITNALNQVTLYAYDDLNNKTNEVISGVLTNRYTFDTNSLLLFSVNALNETNGFTYNLNGQPVTVTDPLGHVTTHFYDNDTGLLLGTADSLGTGVTNFYSNGLLQSSQDALGTTTTYLYDLYGNVTNITVRNAAGTVLSKTSATFDENNNRQTQTITRTLPDGTSTNHTTSYFYDAQNRLTHTVEPDGQTNRVVFNEIGQQKQVFDKIGRATSYDYDAQGRLFKVTHPDTLYEQHLYDGEGRRTNFVDRAGRETRYGYDELGRLTSVTNAFGTGDQAVTRTTFDAAGRVTYTVDARGTTNAFGNDAAGRRVAVTNAWGTAVQQTNGYAYDGVGNQSTVTDALGRVTEFRYDERNRRKQTILPAVVAGGPTFTNSVGYDVANRRIAETNAAGIASRFSYDGVGRLLSVTNGLGSGTATNWAAFAYDEAGNLTNQVDALGRQTKFEYDGLGRRMKRTLPLGASYFEAFSYDAAGNATNHTTFNGQMIRSQYDALNRLTNQYHWTGSVSNQLARSGYSATGRLTSRTEVSGSYTWVYDARDRVKTNTQPAGTLYYGYDANGNVSSIQSSSANGTLVAYSYDALNRLTNVVDRFSNATRYSYDGVGNLAGLRYPNNATNLFQYDSLNRLTNLTWKLNAATLASYAYKLSTANQRTNLVEANGRTVNWAYDALNRLQSEAVSADPNGVNGTLSYGYDLAGNRTSRGGSLDGLSAQSFTYNANDWISGDSFDNAGNTTVSGGITHQYDYANRLTNYSSGPVALVYDEADNRVKKTASGVTTWYLVDDRNPTGYAQVLEELTTVGGTPTRLYTYGLDLISQRQSGGTTHYYVTDGLGSTRHLLSSGGSLTDTNVFDAFGTRIWSSGSTPNNYLFGGEQYDSNLNRYYLRARYLNQTIGRFLTADSFEGSPSDPLSLHRYLYCHDNPVDHADPSGCFVGSPIGGLSELSLGTTLSQEIQGASGIAAAIAYQHMVRSLVFKITAYAILGTTIAGNVAMVTEPLLGPRELDQFRWQWRRKVEQEESRRGVKALYYYRDQETIAKIVSRRELEASAGKLPDFPPGGYASDIPPWNTTVTQSQLAWAFFEMGALTDRKGVGFFVAFFPDAQWRRLDKTIGFGIAHWNRPAPYS